MNDSETNLLIYKQQISANNCKLKNSGNQGSQCCTRHFHSGRTKFTEDKHIIGQNIYSPPVVKSYVFVDLSKTFLKHFIDQSKYYTFKDFLGSTVDTINDALQSYANSRDNVYFVDRNEAIVADQNEKTYFSVSSDKKPIYIDKNHYTQTGASIVGRYIMEQIDKNN